MIDKEKVSSDEPSKEKVALENKRAGIAEAVGQVIELAEEGKITEDELNVTAKVLHKAYTALKGKESESADGATEKPEAEGEASVGVEKQLESLTETGEPNDIVKLLEEKGGEDRAVQLGGEKANSIARHWLEVAKGKVFESLSREKLVSEVLGFIAIGGIEQYAYKSKDGDTEKGKFVNQLAEKAIGEYVNKLIGTRYTAGYTLFKSEGTTLTSPIEDQRIQLEGGITAFVAQEAQNVENKVVRGVYIDRDVFAGLIDAEIGRAVREKILLKLMTKQV